MGRGFAERDQFVGLVEIEQAVVAVRGAIMASGGSPARRERAIRSCTMLKASIMTVDMPGPMSGAPNTWRCIIFFSARPLRTMQVRGLVLGSIGHRASTTVDHGASGRSVSRNGAMVPRSAMSALRLTAMT